MLHHFPTDAGNFCQLETLDLRDVFYASQQSAEANGAILASAIRGTAHCLKRLLIDNGCAGAEVAEAITSRGARREELSMPCCTGLDDAGLQGIAAACVKLQRLCVGGPSRCVGGFCCWTDHVRTYASPQNMCTSEKPASSPPAGIFLAAM